jgi:ABC-type phosphate/phosphonate transport system substrate-binding protein
MQDVLQEGNKTMSKVLFMVCPHDTAKEPDRWYRLEQYLVRATGIEIQFELSLDFEDFHANLGKADIVYANPTDTLKLISGRSFTPLVRPITNFDEAVLAANTDIANPAIESLQGAELATVKGLIPTNIALHMLTEKGITPATVHHKESWQSVISSIWGGEVPFGVIYKDTYDHLSDQGKGMVNVFAISDEKKAFHSINISPALAAQQQVLTDKLLEMHTDEAGGEVLQELALGQWVPVTQNEIEQMQKLMDIAH